MKKRWSLRCFAITLCLLALIHSSLTLNPRYVPLGKIFTLTCTTVHPNIMELRVNFNSIDGKINNRTMITDRRKYNIKLAENSIFESVFPAEFDVSSRNHTFTLTSKPARSIFTGNYTCKGYNKTKDLVYEDIHYVIVGSPPDFINLTTVAKNDENFRHVKCYNSDDLMMIYCSTNPNLTDKPSIEMYLNGSRVKETHLQGNMLIFVKDLNNTKPEDFHGVVVNCTARNKFGEVSKATRLCVSYISVVGYHGNQFTISIGDVLKCTTTGSQNAVSQWISPNSTIFEQHETDKSIINCTNSFTGTMILECESQQGDQSPATRSFNVTFKGGEKKSATPKSDSDFGWCTIASIIVMFLLILINLILNLSFSSDNTEWTAASAGFSVFSTTWLLIYLAFLVVVHILRSQKSDLVRVFEETLLALSIIICISNVVYLLRHRIKLLLTVCKNKCSGRTEYKAAAPRERETESETEM